MRAAARQNDVYIDMCNNVGTEGALEFCGDSMVADPKGHPVVKANNEEQFLYADIDLTMIVEAREERPYLAMRRSDQYI